MVSSLILCARSAALVSLTCTERVHYAMHCGIWCTDRGRRRSEGCSAAVLRLLHRQRATVRGRPSFKDHPRVTVPVRLVANEEFATLILYIYI